MITVRQIWGPFGFHAEEHHGTVDTLHWYFHGIRDNHRMGSWTLTYTPMTGAFRVTSRKLRRTDGYPCPDTYDMFLSVPGGCIESGLAVDLLRKRLTKEDYARITRARITGQI